MICLKLVLSTSIVWTYLHPSVFFPLFREPVSSFSEDSIYAVSPPQVDRDSHDEFESHVMTGQGHVRVLCRDDMLMYREYVKNRYMWDEQQPDLCEQYAKRDHDLGFNTKYLKLKLTFVCSQRYKRELFLHKSVWLQLFASWIYLFILLRVGSSWWRINLFNLLIFFHFFFFIRVFCPFSIYAIF